MGGVGLVVVVVDPPVLDEHAGFEEVVEVAAVEELVAEPAVEALDPGVLPRRAGVDEDRRGAVESEPVCDGVRNELGSVVEAYDPGRHAPLGDDPVENPDDVVGVDGAVDLDGEAFAGELVDYLERLQSVTIHGGVELEDERPQGVGSDRAHRPDVGADPGQALLASFDWDTRTLFTS